MIAALIGRGWMKPGFQLARFLTFYTLGVDRDLLGDSLQDALEYAWIFHGMILLAGTARRCSFIFGSNAGRQVAVAVVLMAASAQLAVAGVAREL